VHLFLQSQTEVIFHFFTAKNSVVFNAQKLREKDVLRVLAVSFLLIFKLKHAKVFVSNNEQQF